MNSFGPMLSCPFGHAQIKSLGACTGTPKDCSPDSEQSRLADNQFHMIQLNWLPRELRIALNQGAQDPVVDSVSPDVNGTAAPCTATSSIPAGCVAFEALTRNASPAVPY